MVHYYGRKTFFKSLGICAAAADVLGAVPMFTKPRRIANVVCHASAWDLDSLEDLRIKLCIDITEEDFTTIHHELGHNFYQRAYR